VDEISFVGKLPAGKEVALPLVGPAGRLSLWIFYGLLAYVPLHIFLSTWVGTSFHILNFAKVAKDIVLIIGFLCALAASVPRPWFKRLLRDKLVWLILAFVALNVVLALIRPSDQGAEVLGVVYDTRFLIFFLYAILISKLFDAPAVRRWALRIVLGVGTLVLFFGIIQYTVLPNDALRHVGYTRANGVLPAFFIDDKPDLERVMSTLRDPNSFGSYIIIIGSIALAFLARSKNAQLRKLTLWLLVLSGLALWYTFSRSAWLGFAASGAVVLLLNFKKHIASTSTRKYILIGLACLVILAGLFAARRTYFAQNVIFHADKSTVLENPNQLRLRFWRESVQDATHNPLGHGPGTAGLASIHNTKQGVVLTENYYLQIAHELGIAGIVLFVAILCWVGLRLYRLAGKDILALGLLASFIGLALTNFLVHIWANEAVAYTWWALAGLVIGAGLVRGPSSHKKS